MAEQTGLCYVFGNPEDRFSRVMDHISKANDAAYPANSPKAACISGPAKASS